uniref:Ty3 transposon capsid-like protein domain-containing protein n=1 Tax=Manihot esculenta TaxID=3983 RepID=A0A2C9UNY7_MANES
MDQRVELLEQSIQSLSGGQEGIAKRLEELFSQLNSRMDRLSIQSSPGKGVESEAHTPESRTNLTRSRSTFYTPKLVKLDFPRFDEKEDPSSWVCRAEQFFQFYHTTDDERVEIASFHLNLVITWADFKEGFYARYGPNQLIDYFGELSKLQQRGTIQMYQTQFEKLLAKVGPLSQARQVGCFISGLISSIRTDVQANRPKSLSEAIALARLYEAKNSVQVKGTSTTSRPAFQTSRPSPVISQPAANPVKRLTWDELNERKKLALYFKCNEKFRPGHRCKKLFSIQAVLEESDDDMEMEIEEQDQTEVPAISLHAISGFEGPDTMRLRGKLANQFGTILVDSGSTHNFVSEKFARKAGIEPTTSKKIKVLVASGEELMSLGKCTQTEILAMMWFLEHSGCEHWGQ